MSAERIFLSPPCVGAEERAAVAAAFDSNYVAPCGPMVDAFERSLAERAGRRFAVAVSGGTAAIDLAMAEFGVDSSWIVFAPTLTFIATVGPAYHRGARLVFVDAVADGNVDTELLAEAFAAHPGARRMFIGVDLYGRCADHARIAELCRGNDVVFVNDAAEAVGATSSGESSAKAGEIAIWSFNGNKIITTSGGGALLTDDAGIAARAKKASQQSREPFPWYEHAEVGYNYRLSNLLGAVGLAQLAKLDRFIARRAEIKAFYRANLRGFEFIPDVPGENHWLTVALAKDSAARDAALAALAKADIESRPVWKPMHLQPVFAGCPVFGGAVSESLFSRGLCLPSGSGMTDEDLSRVVRSL